jgi:hypothetical protein
VTSETGGPSSIYHSFLLRVWREGEQGAWRSSLENVMTGERHSFPNLASLYDFLQATSPEIEGLNWCDRDEPQPIIAPTDTTATTTTR